MKKEEFRFCGESADELLWLFMLLTVQSSLLWSARLFLALGLQFLLFFFVHRCDMTWIRRGISTKEGFS